MSVVDLPTNGHRAGLEDAEARRRARADARRDPSVTGRELGLRYPREDGTPRSEDWGRKQIRAARAGASGTRAETRESTRDGTAPAARAARSSGPARPAPARASGTRTGTRARHGRPVPAPLLALAAGAFFLVAVVCGVHSYVHIWHLAETAGLGSLSWSLPLGIDGLVVACTCSLLVDRAANQPRSKLALAGVAIGLVGSVTANVMAVPPDLVSQVLAAYPPIALAVAGHLLLRMLGER